MHPHPASEAHPFSPPQFHGCVLTCRGTARRITAILQIRQSSIPYWRKLRSISKPDPGSEIGIERQWLDGGSKDWEWERRSEEVEERKEPEFRCEVVD